MINIEYINAHNINKYRSKKIGIDKSIIQRYNCREEKSISV